MTRNEWTTAEASFVASERNRARAVLLASLVPSVGDGPMALLSLLSPGNTAVIGVF